jgi:four helix bundle protein
MATFKRFEDIEAWQKARELTRQIYNATAQGAFGRDFALRDQLRRACVSVMSNIAEGHGRGGNKEFIQYLSMAIGSANEVCAQLYVALDQEYVSESDFHVLTTLAQETARLTAGLARYLRESDLKGSKYLSNSDSSQDRTSETQEPGTKN